MWRDPYGRQWGERVLVALSTLLAAVVAVTVVADLVAPLLPPLIMLTMFTAALLWFLRRRHY